MPCGLIQQDPFLFQQILRQRLVLRLFQNPGVPDQVQTAVAHRGCFRKVTDNTVYYQSCTVNGRFVIQTVRQYIAGKIIHLHITEIVSVRELLSLF